MQPFGRFTTAIFLFDTLELGGAERQGLLLATYLQEQCDVRVQIWGLTGGPGRLAALCDERGIPWRAVELDWHDRFARAPENLLSLHRLARDLRDERPDFILPYTFFSNVIAGLVWRRTGARVCVWNQRDAGFYLDGFDPWRSAATRLVDDFVANSEAGATALSRATDKPVTVVHNGVVLDPPRRDRTEWRRELAVDDATFVACMVANLHANKDHVTLVRAWREFLDDSASRSVLVLAGRIEETGPEVRKLVGELGLVELVRFLGPVDDVSGLYMVSDVYVHSSTSEGLPNAVLEAMAAGLPVIATDLPGIREAVGPEGVRFLAPCGAVTRLAEQIQVLFADAELRHYAGKTAANRVRDELSATRMCETMVGYLASKLKRDE
jgi:glycosyltransferase involved in cell wall biosynthesis